MTQDRRHLLPYQKRYSFPAGVAGNGQRNKQMRAELAERRERGRQRETDRETERDTPSERETDRESEYNIQSWRDTHLQLLNALFIVKSPVHESHPWYVPNTTRQHSSSLQVPPSPPCRCPAELDVRGCLEICGRLILLRLHRCPHLQLARRARLLIYERCEYGSWDLGLGTPRDTAVVTNRQR